MNWIPLLLSDSSAVLRLRVLRDLMGRAADDVEVRELSLLAQEDPIVTRILAGQRDDGSWMSGLPDDTSGSTAVLATALALMRLGYLGFDGGSAAIRRGAEFLFDQQCEDGSWRLPASRSSEEGAGREGYAMMPMQTALPLRGLASCGFAADPRAERAYDWLLARRLDDGAWPTGIAAGGVLGYVAGYRKMPHSRWGCRSNTTAALVCLALHPERRRSDAARRALDLLLGRETRDQYAFGFEAARMLGAEPAHGFITFHARFDLALLLDLCARTGAPRDDERVAGLVGYIKNLQGPLGLWEYARQPHVSRWLTFDLLRSLALLETGAAQSDWIRLESKTPFQAYPKKQKRY